MAANGQVLIVPANRQALTLYNSLRGAGLQEKMGNLKPIRLSPFMDALYTNLPALGRNVRARQHAAYLLRNFAEGVKAMEGADEKFAEARKLLPMDAEKARAVAKEAAKLYESAAASFTKSGDEAQASHCNRMMHEAELMAKRSDEKPHQVAQMPQASTARRGGVRSGSDVATGETKRGEGGPKWSWQDSQKPSHIG